MKTKQSVVDNFISMNRYLEGVVPHMYLDRVGLVTVGMGNLIEPMVLGAGFPWRREDGKLASAQEYAYEWNLINGHTELAQEGWTSATRLCRLHLSPEDIQTLVKVKLEANEAELIKRVPAFGDHCADAQAMLHSWAWAVGPGANYPRMLKLINAFKYGAATGECDINPKEGTIILRNAMNRQLLTNAQRVYDRLGTADEFNPEQLMYPWLGQEPGDGKFDHTVAGLQHALNLVGFQLVQDGILGEATTAAVKRFQASRKLTVDGNAGPLTWAAINQALRFR